MYTRLSKELSRISELVLRLLDIKGAMGSNPTADPYGIAAASVPLTKAEPASVEIHAVPITVSTGECSDA